MRLLIENQDAFLSESRDILRAGLTSADWITVDDTGARHQAKNGFCTHIGNDQFASFTTTSSKSRLNFLELLTAGDTTHLINDAAIAYMRERNLSEVVINQLAAHSENSFANREAWMAHLERLQITALKINPDPVRDVGDHALCWLHAERLIHKLDAFTEEQRHAKERIREQIWRLYADLKAYRNKPTQKLKAELTRRFKKIFTTQTGFATLDRLLSRLHAQQDQLLAVLERPDIPLHTNGSENDIRCQVTRRKTVATPFSVLRQASHPLLGLSRRPPWCARRRRRTTAGRTRRSTSPALKAKFSPMIRRLSFTWGDSSTA
jgi:hypothetical protein